MSGTNVSTRSADLMGEALLFSLLGKALYEDLDKTWLETLVGEGVFAEVPFGSEWKEVQVGLDLLQRWSEAQRGVVSEVEFQCLKQDQLYLFIGAGTVLAAPWESVYFGKERMIFQEQTLQVRQWYSRFGLQVANLHNEPDDHIGLELEFVAHLANLALQAVDQKNDGSLEDLLQAQRDFLSEHLLRWEPAWANLVKKHANTDFYRGLGTLNTRCVVGRGRLSPDQNAQRGKD